LLRSRLENEGKLFRLSGARYAILLEDHNDQRAMAVAETLRIIVAASPMMWESKRTPITASFGVAEFDNRLIKPIEVIQRAEKACTAAKFDGRNRVVTWTKELGEILEPVDDAVWIRRLRTGLDKNLLHLTTQLIKPSPLHQATGNVFEVLVTLEDEEGFWSNAATFIPAAERHQMMPELDCWVISKTIAHLENHPTQTESIDFVTINISASSLDSTLVLEHIVKTFEKNPKVPAKLICFEISEEIATSHMRQAQTFSEAMRGLGCRMSVDRFSGRHISDISLLRRLPLDFVKVDSLQFRNISKDDVEQTIAESLIRLARALKKRVIVANLEDSARYEAWKKLGADYFQGHVIAKPTPVIFLAPP
jgi:EAL domain-containing protein (putative c-di-GMP-specific phosphodiesterase class I)